MFALLITILICMGSGIILMQKEMFIILGVNQPLGLNVWLLLK